MDNVVLKKATGSDQAVGVGMMVLGVVIFVYYSLWVVVMPFVNADHVIQNLFPNRMYAVLIPVIAGVCLLFVVGLFISVVLLKKSTKKTN